MEISPSELELLTRLITEALIKQLCEDGYAVLPYDSES